MTREEGWKLLCDYTRSDSLRKHGLAVEATMRFYARKQDADEEVWGLAGLLHDFDYERWPQPPDHTRQGAAILRERGVNEEVIGAVLSHVEWNLDDYPRDRPLRKTLFATDESSGFIVACARVRPTRLEGLTPSSVQKKLKTPSFAAGVSREDIQTGADLLELDLKDHLQNCIDALTPVAERLGLTPREPLAEANGF